MWWYSPGYTTVPLMKGGLLSQYTADFRVRTRRTSESTSWSQRSDKSTDLVIELFPIARFRYRVDRGVGGCRPPVPRPSLENKWKMTVTSEGREMDLLELLKIKREWLPRETWEAVRLCGRAWD